MRMRESNEKTLASVVIDPTVTFDRTLIALPVQSSANGHCTASQDSDKRAN